MQENGYNWDRDYVKQNKPDSERQILRCQMWTLDLSEYVCTCVCMYMYIYACMFVECVCTCVYMHALQNPQRDREGINRA